MYESSLDASDSSVAASSSSSSSSAGVGKFAKDVKRGVGAGGRGGEVRAGATDLATDLATPEPLDTFAHCSGSGARSGRGSMSLRRIRGRGRESGERFGRRRGGRGEGAEGEGAPLHARGELSVVLTVAAAAAAAALLLLLLLGRAWDGGTGRSSRQSGAGRAGGLGCSPSSARPDAGDDARRRSRRRARTRLRMASDVGTRDWVATRTWTHGADARRHAGGTRTRRRDVLVHRRRRLLPRRAATATVAAGVELAERREHGHA